ncbi:hypothetical protein ACNPPY_14830 [Achromobacter sp. AGC78]
MHGPIMAMQSYSPGSLMGICWATCPRCCWLQSCWVH